MELKLSKEKKVLAIVPARGGSKRIPRKNCKLFHGKPLISYVLENLKKCEFIDEIIVTTDDDEIKDIAINYDLPPRYSRNEENATDHATTADVIKEVISKYQADGHIFDYIMCVYPAAVCIKKEIFKEAFDVFSKSPQTSLASVVKYDHPIQRAFSINETGSIKINNLEESRKRTQDLEEFFHDAGQFYFAKKEHFEKTFRFLEGDCLGFPIDPSIVQDIDTMSDWNLAEIKYQFQNR